MRPTRRDVLRAGLLGGAALGGAHEFGALLDALAACGPRAATLTDVEHIIIFIQENRSFDHYFGSYKGVRGYADPAAPASAFAQAYAASAKGVPKPLYPWHLDTAVSIPPTPKQGVCTNDIEHQWAGQHDSWNGGRNDNWMNSHIATEPTPRQASIAMGYYRRADLPFYYALADHFTICDGYFCSVIAGTDVNRLYSMTGTIDPDGWDGGMQFLDTKTGTVNNPGADLGTGRRWVPYPEVLSAAGISWKVYGTADAQLGDNVLRYFPQYRPLTGDPALSHSAFPAAGAGGTFPLDFIADCRSGSLPAVSWVLASLAQTDHAPGPITFGESIVQQTLAGLASSGAWAKSVLFLTYDENGGFFDHVAPPTPPPGTPGEFLNRAAMSALARKEATTTSGVDTSGGPIGLGYRVPLLVISPFTRNPRPGVTDPPLVCSDVFDHTSLLRFVETWSIAKGRPARIPDRDPEARRPGLSAWRRRTAGDLTSAFSFGQPPDAGVPTDLLTGLVNPLGPETVAECVPNGTALSLTSQTAPAVPDPTVNGGTTRPGQEAAPSVRRPVPPAACTAGAGSAPASVDATLATAGAAGLANTAAPRPGSGAALAAGLTAAGVLAAARWRASRDETPT